MLICLLVLSSTIFFLTSPVQAQPTISSFPAPLPQGRVGILYNATLTAAGGIPPYTWGTPVGLPPGLSFTPAGNTGTISGTPTTVGTFPFSITVTDNATASAVFTNPITIISPGLTLVTISLPQATEGSAYTATISVTGGTSPYTWAIASGAPPPGLTLGATTGVISGTPAHGTAGIHSFTISITDSSTPALSGQRNFSITVEKGSYESIVTIAPSLSAGKTKVFVGRSQVATLGGGESIRLDSDLGTSQTISVEPIVSHPTETGVRFKAEVDSTVVNELSANAYFTYYAEYFIELKTKPSQITQLTGSGWYKEGYMLRASAPTEVDVEDTPGTQYRFGHWLLPTGETVKDEDLSLPISMSGVIIANYDTYYQLTLTSPHGEPEGSAWYKAGSQAEWGVVAKEVSMSGILGFFGGKLEAINYSGTEVMDAPKTITIAWKPNYTMPFILIPLALILIILGGFVIYRLWQGLQPKPAPVAPIPQAMPPPQTTVVMIGDTSKRSPQTTREQLMEKFGELLEKYEHEIRASIGAKEAESLPKIETVREEKRLPAAESTPPSVLEAEVAQEEEEGLLCNFASKRLLRTVASNWRQVTTKTTDLPPTGKKTAARGTGLAVVWARDIYNEWEILTCSLPRGHGGTHQGSLEIVYSLLNTVTKEKIYGPRQKLKPPTPHFTDGMPEVEITADQIMLPGQLPTETLS